VPKPYTFGAREALGSAWQTLQLTLQFYPVGRIDDLDDVFAAITRDRASAVLVIPHPFLYVHAKQLVELAKQRGGKDNITVVLVRLAADEQDTDDRARRLALKREVLQRMPLFARLQDRELLRVMQAVEVRAFQDGQVVITEGEKGDELFIVLSGKVAVLRGGEVLTRLGAGEHFGEMALNREVPHSATVNADGPAELIIIRRHDFFELLRTEHEIAVKMLWQFLGVLADRLDTTSRDLRVAKQELHAEDISDDDGVTIEIFPGLDSDRAPSVRR